MVFGNNSLIRLARLGRGTGGLPLGPKMCVVGSGDRGVVCVKGTGTLGGHMARCFNTNGRRAPGIHGVIRGIISFRCVIYSDRFRTLVLRGSLVGRRRPGCGVLLGSSGNDFCVGVASSG